MEEDKYISFDGWWGGFSNIRMTYELIGAISTITKRTIILPPKLYCSFLSDHSKKDTFFNWWDAFDLNAFESQFKCIHYKDIIEYTTLENNIQYFENIDKIAKIIMFQDDFKQWGTQREIANNQVLVYNIDNQDDFFNFSLGREIVNLDLPDKFIHFPRNLFGHFYYHIYGNNPSQRNIIRDKIQNGIKYRPEFFQKFKLVKEKIGLYNAIHVRRNDFTYTHPSIVENQLDNLLNNIKDRIPNSIPLYIATDEQNKELFDCLKPHYTIYFQNDFYSDLNTHESLILDQITCSEADIFLGSKLSTYSDYINVLRGYNNKKDFHREGINFHHPKLEYLRFPWEVENYSWDRIHDCYWKREELVNI